MIAGLRGTLEAIGGDFVILEVGGISYKVFVPTSTLAKMQGIGDVVKLFTHTHVREDVLALFGFMSRAELDAFEMLIGVGGIGPKAALNILSSIAPDELALAISTGNTDLLTRIPGIGKKMAGRMVLELKGKFDPGQSMTISGAGKSGNADVIAALTSLGYTAAEIAMALGSLSQSDSLSTEEQIRLALLHFASAR